MKTMALDGKVKTASMLALVVVLAGAAAAFACFVSTVVLFATMALLAGTFIVLVKRNREIFNAYKEFFVREDFDQGGFSEFSRNNKDKVQKFNHEGLVAIIVTVIGALILAIVDRMTGAFGGF